MSGATQQVFSAGTAIGTTVSDGNEFVQQSGLAISTTVHLGGFQQVISAGTALQTTVAGGEQILGATGLASGTTVVSFGFQFVDSTGVALATTVKNHGTDVVEGGGAVSGLIVSSGGLFEGIGNAIVIAAQFRSGALIGVGSGFVFNSAVGNGVTEQVLSAGTAPARSAAAAR